MKYLLSTVFLSAIISGGAIAQTAPTRTPLRLGNVKFRSVETPQYNVRVDGSGGNQRARNEWLEAVVEFETAPEWTDELTFTFFIMLKGDKKDLPQGSSVLNNFTGEVTYVNLPKENDHRASIYIEPMVFRRYGEVQAVAVEAKYRGQVVATAISTGSPKTKWWAAPTYPPISGHLRNKSQTPFIFVDYDQHPPIKSPAAGQ